MHSGGNPVFPHSGPDTYSDPQTVWRPERVTRFETAGGNSERSEWPIVARRSKPVKHIFDGEYRLVLLKD